MIARVRKWGNSLGLRIPRSLAGEAGVRSGTEVDLTMRGGRIVIRPVQAARYRLGDLLRRITKDNLHEAVEDGGPVGRELL